MVVGKVYTVHSESKMRRYAVLECIAVYKDGSATFRSVITGWTFTANKVWECPDGINWQDAHDFRYTRRDADGFWHEISFEEVHG